MKDDDAVRRWWKWPSGLGQDPICPILVEHTHEYGNPYQDTDGRHWFGHRYDYLTYRFREGSEAAEAMHYRDEEGRVRVDFFGDGADLRSSSFARRVLIFLAMRYDTINDDEDLMAEVRVWRDEHMRRNAT